MAHPDLVHHNATQFAKSVIELAPGVWTAVGFAASTQHMIEGARSVTIVDTSESTGAARQVLAAFRGEKVAGFGLIGPKRADGAAELCALFVSSGMRQAGVGERLFEELLVRARQAGAGALLIYANPTASSVDFYRKQGCTIIGLADKRLVSQLPWDVVFARAI